ncbi:non-specific lipid transfer protein GPI-anchored 5-like [Amaranthus tricolor]|uniref:non-specific lipid transfer protein GPI-anchored 5-like n=1 Tax=Amaranthus tricolor TaxID=29722 RepID=UPI002590AAEE|nr:non-specific lipid transfer protein GPI-anchored 5-like [Amaranthus tricolor]
MRITYVIMMIPVFWALVLAQPSCPGALTSLTPCLSFGVGNSSTPTSSCCSELANMLQTVPTCICDVLNGSGAQALGVLLNQTLARALPSACDIKTSALPQCDGLVPETTGNGAYSQGSVIKIPLLLVLAISFTLLATFFQF